MAIIPEKMMIRFANGKGGTRIPRIADLAIRDLNL
jgi:hypothetical protein